MNYSHHFHAGNFADVFKHVWLTRILLHLARKDAPFRYIETHAGPGLYDLRGPEAARANEWQDGIGRLATAGFPPACRDLLADYLSAVGALDGQAPQAYPGSPLIAQGLLRPQDRMTVCELHPPRFEELVVNLGRDPRAKAVNIDGYVGLNAFLPPKERRGLVMIDPPFEAADEFERLQAALAGALRKWATGIYAVWYPLKQRHGDAASRLAPVDLPKRLWIELRPGPSRGGDAEGLAGCGVFVVNPPHGLAEQCTIVMPELARVLGRGAAGDWRIVT